ncbi:MAG: thymidine phosphorylase [Bacteroides sp.]|nr:thymidine phosphorylase [Prevotella sp.]MCM1407471.1 thymidine phosphorylase [Treponema brennaborense]MCM1469961.1 thymidine phosphorylase [Bacteroides sp.]
MRAADIIIKKRGSVLNPSGAELTAEEITFLINNFVSGNIPDYQMAAWLMAVYFNGMTFRETAALTSAMLNSGDVMPLDSITAVKTCADFNGIFADKHSTGGVGDKISLPLAPIAAACGCAVPMMSGRALGHTGGTLDKLESIKGYRTNLQPDEFMRILSQTGFAMTGQTEKIAPADRLLYALRDVTGTVESIPLITASILSKKIAEGSDVLVFDVKYGTGAFMQTAETAETLALSLVNTAKSMGKKTAALITDMNTPLGFKTGNFLEIEETLDCLDGKGPDDIMELTYSLTEKMLLLCGLAADKTGAEKKCRNAVSSGKAKELFFENIRLQGGDPERVLKEYGTRRSPYKQELTAEKDGFLSIDARGIGTAGIYLGVGRNKTTDCVCPDAGIIFHKRQGDAISKGDILMEIYGKDEECFSAAMPCIHDAVRYSDTQNASRSLILKEIV